MEPGVHTHFHYFVLFDVPLKEGMYVQWGLVTVMEGIAHGNSPGLVG